MEVSIKVNGLDSLNALLEKMQEQASELRSTLTEINRATANLGVEINQPTAGTIG